MKKYLIVLTNAIDLEVVLANEAAMQWIQTEPAAFSALSVQEQIPADVLAGFEENYFDDDDKTFRLTSGSWMNDRARACPGICFDSVSDAIEHIRANDIELIGEFVGLVY